MSMHFYLVVSVALITLRFWLLLRWTVLIF